MRALAIGFCLFAVLLNVAAWSMTGRSYHLVLAAVLALCVVLLAVMVRE